ncbi:MAG TPA: hypothetical protein VF024_12175 [Solirubrobacteraceae bacterium]
MSDETRECPIDDCTHQHSRRLAMCAQHWRMVPERVQLEVYRLYREAPGSGEHLQALENAIASVEGRAPRELFA